MCLILFFSFQAKAAHGPIHLYAALGTNFSPASFRIGSGDWELGMLNNYYGFDKIFDFGSRFYSGFGFVYTSYLGFYGSMGLKFDVWIIPFRAELAAIIDTKAQGYASGLIGVTYGF